MFLNTVNSDIFEEVYGGDIPTIDSPNIDSICTELYQHIMLGSTIFVYGDYDADGFYCMQVWKEVFHGIGFKNVEFFKYTNRTHNIDYALISQLEKSAATVVIICDTGSSEYDRFVLNSIKVLNKIPIVIDHHTFVGDYDVTSKNLLIFNSYCERELLNGNLVSGAYASLLVANVLCTKYFQIPLSHSAKIFALASMYSDVVDVSTPVGRALYNAVAKDDDTSSRFWRVFNKYGYKFGRRLFSFQLAPPINNCFRNEYFVPLNKLLLANTISEITESYGDMQQNNRECHDVIPYFLEHLNYIDCGSIVIAICNLTPELLSLKMPNFTGIVATRVAQDRRCGAVVLYHSDDGYAGSYRDYYNRPLLSKFKLFCVANGHDAAFGLSFMDFHDFHENIKVLGSSTLISGTPRQMTVSPSVIETMDDLLAAVLYNEYNNVNGTLYIKVPTNKLRLSTVTKYYQLYDSGLPTYIKSTSAISRTETSTILVEPCLCRGPELRVSV